MPNRIDLKIHLATFQITPFDGNWYLFCIKCKREPNWNHISVNIRRHDGSIWFSHFTCGQPLLFLPLKGGEPQLRSKEMIFADVPVTTVIKHAMFVSRVDSDTVCGIELDAENIKAESIKEVNCRACSTRIMEFLHSRGMRW